MTDFGTLTTEVLDDLKRSDLTAQAQTKIKSAIKYYERRKFWFLEQRSTTTLVDGQEYYGLPADFRDESSLVITVNNWTYPLNKRTYEILEAWFVKSATFTGYPTDYAIYDEQLRLYPIPNGAHVMTLSYYKQLATLSAATDANAWTSEGAELIKARAEKVLYAQTIRDQKSSTFMAGIEKEELTQHESLTNTRLMTGHSKKRGVTRS